MNRWGGTGRRQKGLVALERRVLIRASAVPSPLPSLTPRESLYQLLSQTSPDNMHRNVAQYGLDPATRYPNLNLRAVTPNQVRAPGTRQTPGLPCHCPCG